MASTDNLNERSLIKSLRELILKAVDEKKGFVTDIWKVLPEKGSSINLASKRFLKFWKKWWGNGYIPQLEIDLILVLNSEVKIDDLSLGKTCLLGVEVKFFKPKSNMNFYEGLDQALAYLRIGLDKVALLHIFHPECSEDLIRRHVKAMESLVDGLKLPIAYVACKLVSLEGLGRFALFTQYVRPCEVDITYVVYYLKQAPINPLFKNVTHGSEVQRLRSTLLALLKIPRT